MQTQSMERRRSEKGQSCRGISSETREERQEETRVAMGASWSDATPVGVRAHAGAEPWNLFTWIGADRKGSQIEISGGPCCPPAGIFALRGDEAHLDRELVISESGDSDFECVAQLQVLCEI